MIRLHAKPDIFPRNMGTLILSFCFLFAAVTALAQAPATPPPEGEPRITPMTRMAHQESSYTPFASLA